MKVIDVVGKAAEISEFSFYTFCIFFLFYDTSAAPVSMGINSMH